MVLVTACHTNSYKKLPPIDEFRNWLAAENAEEGVTKIAGLAGLNGLVLRLIAGVSEE